MNESSTVTEVYEIIKVSSDDNGSDTVETINNITWHLLNKPVKELGNSGSNMDVKSGTITCLLYTSFPTGEN